MNHSRVSVEIDRRVSVQYDGRTAFPDPTQQQSLGAAALRVGVTVALVVGPFLGLALAAWTSWGRDFGPRDVALAVLFYVITGLGVTLGFHRGATHGSFTSKRPLQLVLCVCGSMAFEGSVIDWVATHRRHHAFTDRPGDPHSPYRYGTGLWAQVRGLFHAHIGWLLHNDPTPQKHYAPDLLADPMMRKVNAAFPLLCIASLAAPFMAGWGLSGELHGGLTGFVWAGLARVALLQHVTWSVNSLCHMIGDRPYPTRRFDRATNLWPLALLSFGESWHNGHHSDPSCARHGRGARQVDLSAAAIRGLERLGWVTNVHWHKPDTNAGTGPAVHRT